MEADRTQGFECVKGTEKARESKGLLEQLKRETWEEVTQIKADADSAENKRRQKEDKRRKERYEMIKNETIESSTKNEAAQIKWDDLLELEECEELAAAIEEQKAECRKIIENKDKLIKEFQEEIKEKDGFYVKAIRKQEEDIEKIIALMRKQYVSIRDEYALQLEAIEETFLEERSELLKANRQEIDELFRRHEELENKFKNERQTMEEENADELENKRDEDANNLHITKVQVENNLQILESHMEEMKAIYQLHLDKLQYNVKILQERKVENEATLKDLERRKKNLRNSYSNLNKAVELKEKEFMRENAHLTDKFKKMSKAFNELRKKFRHFEKADTKKFEEIQNMNKEEVAEIATRVGKCDKIVYEQQLGLPWSPPENASVEIQPSAESKTQKKTKEQTKQPTEQVPIQRIQKVFELLVAECSFLIEDKVIDQCRGLDSKEQFKRKVDSIRQTIGIESMQDVKRLVALFYKPSSDSDELLVPQHKVIEALMSFQEQKEKPVGSVSNYNEPSMYSAFSQSKDTDKARRLQQIEQEKQDWQKLGGVLSDKHLRVWRALEKAFSQYHKMLQERQGLVEETGVLHQQNEELKSLLQQYLQAGVNQELQVPPTQMLKLGDEE